MKKTLLLLSAAMAAISLCSTAYPAIAATNSTLSGTESDGKLNWLGTNIWVVAGATPSPLPGGRPGAEDDDSVRIGNYANDYVYLSGNANAGNTGNIGAISLGYPSTGYAGTLEIRNEGYLRSNSNINIGDRSSGNFIMTGGTAIFSNINMATGASTTLSVATISGSASLEATSAINLGNESATSGKAVLRIHGSKASVQVGTGLSIRKNGSVEFKADASGFSTLKIGTSLQMAPNAISLSADQVIKLDLMGLTAGDYVDQILTFTLINATNSHATTTNHLLLSSTTDAILGAALYDDTRYSLESLVWDSSSYDLILKVKVLSLIPEPSTYAVLAALGALAFVLYRRRRK